MSPEQDRLLTPKEAAEYLGVSTLTLKDWRYHGRGPTFIRLSHKMIRYRVSALIQFVESSPTIKEGRRIAPISAPTPTGAPTPAATSVGRVLRTAVPGVQPGL
jgi:predicted DNA-binding transcriptional regulator AlpA